jgi:hypothetical protein
MLRANGFWASSASLSVARPTLLLPPPFDFLSEDLAIAFSYAVITEA